MEQGNLGAVEDSELVSVLLYGALLGVARIPIAIPKFATHTLLYLND